MPAGSCPICNGMGGGATAPKRPDVRKSGEMSWSECFAMGLRMKADKLHRQQAIQARIDAQSALLQLQTKLANAAARLQMMADMVHKSFPSPINKIIPAVIKNIALPVLKLSQTLLNFTNNLVQNTAKFFTSIKENLQGVQEKLAAIFGELINAKEKSLSERFKTARKKIFSIFFKGETEEEIEIKQIEESEREAELKKVKDSLLNLNNYKSEIEEAENDHNSAV